MRGQHAKWAYGALAALLAGAALDWVVLDRWQFSGEVRAASNGAAIDNALVLADFRGEKPLVRLPIPPHPQHRTSACMGTAIARTDARGRFLFDELHLNRPLANKTVHITVFKPGWHGYQETFQVRSSLFATPVRAEIAVARATDTKTAVRSNLVASLDSLLSAEEKLLSDELRSTLTVISSTCDYEGFHVAENAFEHALRIASTYSERARVRGACLYVQSSVERMKAAKQKRGWQRVRASDTYKWRFDCDQLPFAKPPSPQTAAVEAELATRRRSL